MTAPVVGRDRELRHLERFLEEGGSSDCLVLWGEPGIGKTTIWEAGLELAGQLGFTVLSTRTSESEATLSFTALVDLVEGVDEQYLAALPAPQRRSLEVALRRAESEPEDSDPVATSAGFLNLLRALVDQGPLLIAVDDLQWLDSASQAPLLFAARRLSGDRVRFLFTRRPGPRSELERAISPTRTRLVEVAALSIGALGRVLSDRFGLELSRRAMRHLHEGSQGNPLLALELGRVLAERKVPAFRGEVPLPELAEDVFGPRITQASDTERQILLAVALSGGLREDELLGLFDHLEVELAVSDRLVVIDRSRVRPAHPMLATAATRHASAAERQALHLELASVVSDPVLRAQHLAAAAAAPDAALADRTAAAAELAAGRGSIWEAMQLGEHALRLTPPGDPARGGRILALARICGTTGRIGRMAELLEANLNELHAGRDRALGHLLLVWDAEDDDATYEHLARALEEAGDDPEVEAIVYGRRATAMALGGLKRVDEAETWARTATALAAQSAEPGVREQAVAALAWTCALGGKPIEVVDGAASSGSHMSVYEASIRPIGVQLAFRGQIERAREVFGELLALAEERGELRSMAAILLQRCEVELRAGHLHDAAHLLTEVEELLATQEERPATLPRLRSLLAAERGATDEAIVCATEVLERERLVSGPSESWDRLEARRALGLAAHFHGDAERAAERLTEIWEHGRREHIDDPGAFPVAGDLVEALVQLGQFDEANAVVERLGLLSREQEHPWGLATLQRCVSLVRLASADEYDDEAAGELAAAAATYEELGLDFDRSRTLLSLGVVQRRFKKRGSARQSLEQAATVFDACGSPGWASRARSELERVSGRRSVPSDQLTPTERKTIDLAGSGLSNKEIARQLFVSVNTVEGHLSRAYAKLGVRSRGELARLLGESAGE